MDADHGGDPHDRRLNTWKEIAAFFGCDERTVKRWETARGLPVRRVPNGARSTVFAYENELRAWLNNHKSGTSPLAESGAKSRYRWIPQGRIAIGALLGLLLVLAGAFWTLDPVGRNAGRAARIAVAQAPGNSVTPGTSASSRASAEAQSFYRSGLYAWQTRTPAGLASAVDDFTQAIVRDPHYALAYAGLANCYALLREYTTMAPEYAFPRAKAAAERAIALDPSLGDAHAALAFVEFYWLRDAATARREFDRAISLSPRNATAHHWYATFLLALGEFPRALSEMGIAEELDPESKSILADKGIVLFYAGHAREARALLAQMEQTEPQFASPHRYLAIIYRAEGDDAGFLREASLAAEARHDSDDEKTLSDARKGLARSGHLGMLQAMRDAQEALVREGRGSAYALAETAADLGDSAAAIAWLGESLSRGEADATALAIEPDFRSLHHLGPFRQLIERAGVSRRL